MDIQKEREAFEDWFSCNAIRDHEYVRGERMDEKGNYYSEYAYLAWSAWQAAKAQVSEGFVLVPVDQLNQWGHMANYAEQYGCPECFEARGYAHTLTCEINEYFAIETQEPTND